MDRRTLTGFVETLKRAWMDKDLGGIAELFAEYATYQENPFDPPLQGRAAIVDYWSAMPEAHERVQFDYEILAVTAEVGVVHWQVSLQRMPAGTTDKLDGVFVATFDEQGRCIQFREWWMKRE